MARGEINARVWSGLDQRREKLVRERVKELRWKEEGMVARRAEREWWTECEGGTWLLAWGSVSFFCLKFSFSYFAKV